MLVKLFCLDNFLDKLGFVEHSDIVDKVYVWWSIKELSVEEGLRDTRNCRPCYRYKWWWSWRVRMSMGKWGASGQCVKVARLSLERCWCKGAAHRAVWSSPTITFEAVLRIGWPCGEWNELPPIERFSASMEAVTIWEPWGPQGRSTTGSPRLWKSLSGIDCERAELELTWESVQSDSAFIFLT